MAEGFDREGLEDFVARGEKSSPPVFVGRDRVIRDIQRAAALVWKHRDRGGVPGATRILHGAPGAGKSSILAELRDRSLAADQAEGTPRVLTVSSRELKQDLPGVLAAVAAIGRTPHGDWIRWARGIAGRLTASIGFAGLRIGLEGGAGKPPANLSDLAAAMKPDEWWAPVAVAVDEAQNLSPDPDSPPALLCQGIHDADTALPLTLVLAGLGNTLNRAHDMGLTRGSTLHGIEGLTDRETRKLAEGFCRRFGLRADASRRVLSELAAPAEGWPRHLHFALRALGEEALETDGDLRRIDWSRAMKEAADSRMRYYRSQQSPEMREAEPLVAGVMAQLGGRPNSFGIIKYLRTASAADPDMSLPEGMTVKGFLGHLLHRGALQERSDRTVHCPIPSFRSFLMKQGGLEAERDTGPATRARPSHGFELF